MDDLKQIAFAGRDNFQKYAMILTGTDIQKYFETAGTAYTPASMRRGMTDFFHNAVQYKTSNIEDEMICAIRIRKIEIETRARALDVASSTTEPPNYGSNASKTRNHAQSVHDAYISAPGQLELHGKISYNKDVPTS